MEQDTVFQLARTCPSIADYLPKFTPIVVRDSLAADLDALGESLSNCQISINKPRFNQAVQDGIREQYLIRALNVAQALAKRDLRTVGRLVPTFWGSRPDRALHVLFTTNNGLLSDPSTIIDGAMNCVERLIPKRGFSLPRILTIQVLTHHVAKATGAILINLNNTDLTSPEAFYVRGAVVGAIIRDSDFDKAHEYGALVSRTHPLRMIERWAFPTWMLDSHVTGDFVLPQSLSLRLTAREVIRELANYPEAYVWYLSNVYIPIAMQQDVTFGGAVSRLIEALAQRLESLQDASTLRSTEDLIGQLRSYGIV